MSDDINPSRQWTLYTVVGVEPLPFRTKETIFFDSYNVTRIFTRQTDGESNPKLTTSNHYCSTTRIRLRPRVDTKSTEYTEKKKTNLVKG